MSKHKLYKIALVSIVMVLMLVSTVGVVRLGDGFRCKKIQKKYVNL